MARAIEGPDRVSLAHLFGSSSGKRIWVVSLGLTVILGVTGILGTHAGARDWIWSSLGYGFIPAGLWVVTFGLALRCKRTLISHFYPLWIASALAVAAVLGILSLFYPRTGILEETGLSGNWGRVLGGEPTTLAILKIAITLWLVPVALMPQRTFSLHRKGIKGLWHSPGWVWTVCASLIRSSKQTDSLEQISNENAQTSLPRRIKHGVANLPRIRAKDAKKQPVDTRNEPEGNRRVTKVSRWRLPNVELLERTEMRTAPESMLKELANSIETTLSEHGVDVSVKDIKTGPRVIRFGLVPGWVKKYRDLRVDKTNSESASEMSRVKVHSILARERDLALVLKTSDLRIESPVPGEALVGIEVPNPVPNLVSLRATAESIPFKRIIREGGMALGLGQGTGGEPVAEDLLELPHLLIAGATGSGKSVCVNAIISSLLMANRPDRVRMIMVDPKRVELTPFNGVPHLVAPVIVDSNKVLPTLRGLLREMFRRYKLLEEASVRNIEGYNRKAEQAMSILVLVIDELADLMMAEGYEMEQALVRLAQLGRATGIHLILCTQRPSVNVVTGLLKANIPARIAFAVASQVDSRVILDGGGAEKLLGKGDMLFLSAQSPKPRRIQGTFVADQEIEKVLEFWQSQKGPLLPEISLEDPSTGSTDEMEYEDDDLLDEARHLADNHNRLSASLIQRRLQIGYPRAMRLMELLEKEGSVGTGDPGRSRNVLGRDSAGLPDDG